MLVHAGIGVCRAIHRLPAAHTHPPFPPPPLSLTHARARAHTLTHSHTHTHAQGSELAGLLIDFQPSPITFLAAVTVALPVDDIQTNVSYSAAMFDEENLTWVM